MIAPCLPANTEPGTLSSAVWGHYPLVSIHMLDWMVMFTTSYHPQLQQTQAEVKDLQEKLLTTENKVRMIIVLIDSPSEIELQCRFPFVLLMMC